MAKEISPYVRINDDGSIEIFGTPDGMPVITGVVPAPDVNTKDEKERQNRFDQACDGITLQGYHIVSKKRVRNDVFDDPGQMTTLKIVYRPCKSKKEIEDVYVGMLKILERETERRETAYKQALVRDNPNFLEIE